MAFCPKCGNTLPEGANVCPSCGQALNAPVQTAPRPVRRPIAVSNKLLGNIMMIFALVMLGFAAIAVLYGFIDGIADATKGPSDFEEALEIMNGGGKFERFIVAFFDGFRRAVNYIFYGIVALFLKKNLK